MNEFSIPMALADYIPVFLFGAAAVVLMRDLYNKMSKGAFALFAAGAIDIACAGALKATYKLLYAAGICDFQPLSQMFFPVQSIGFLLAGLGMVAMLCHRQGNTAVYGAAAPPAVFQGTGLFVLVMVVGLGCMMTALSILSVRLKKAGLIAFFALAFVCSLCMGYLSSRDFTEAAANWAAEGVNILGQGSLLAGTLLLHRAGFADVDRKGTAIR